MSNFQPTQFKPITIEDKPTFDHLLDDYPANSCEYNFANLFSWGQIYQFSWHLLGDSIVIYNGLEDEIFMPIGPAPTPDKLAEISDIFISNGKSGRLTLVSEEYIENNRDAIAKLFDIDLDENLNEYIYLTEKLSSLSGKKLRKKRNLIAQFKKNNPNHKIEKIDNRNTLQECLQLAEQWSGSIENLPISITQESLAMQRAIEYFDDLKLTGLVAYTGNTIVAFAIFSRQNNDTYTVHYEKSDASVRGAPQYIVHETALHLLNKCKYINREQDLGLPGLRKSKRSYDPDSIMPKYNLSR